MFGVAFVLLDFLIEKVEWMQSVEQTDFGKIDCHTENTFQ
jgi:hypothetical protein